MSIGSSDLAGSLLMIGGVLVVLAVVAGIVLWAARRRGSQTALIDAALTISAWWAGIGLVGIVISVIQTLTAQEVFVTDVPVSTTWPAELSCGDVGADVDGPHLDCATLPTADLWIAGLTAAPRILLGVGQLFGGLLVILPAAAIAVICLQLLRGAPFARIAERALIVTAVVVLVAGIGVDIAFGIARGLAASEVLPPVGHGPVTASGALFSLSVQLWPIGAALGIAALAAVFRYGSRLQRDTEGLV